MFGKIISIIKIAKKETKDYYRYGVLEIVSALIPLFTAFVFTHMINYIAVQSEVKNLLIFLLLYLLIQVVSLRIHNHHQLLDIKLKQCYELYSKGQIQKRLKTINTLLYEDNNWVIQKLYRVDSLSSTLYDEVTAQFKLISLIVANCCYLFFLSSIQPSLVIWGLLAIVPSILKSVCYGPIHYKKSRELNQHTQRYNRIFGMFFEIAFSQEVRTFQAFDFVKHRWKMALQKVYHCRKKLNFSDHIADFICNLITIAIYTFIVISICRSSAAIGQIVAVIPYSLTIAGYVSSIDMTCKSIYYSLKEWDEIQDFLQKDEDIKLKEMDQEKEFVPVLQPNSALIKVQKVSFSYPQCKEVLKDITFEIHEGESIALVGENGSGKSTLLKLIAGLYQPESGVVLIDGQSSQDFDPDKIGMVFQMPLHYPFSASDNVQLHGEKNNAKDGISQMNLEKLCVKQGVLIPGFFDSINVSGGEWQQIALARLIANKKEALLFLFDEPTSALDPIAELKVFEKFRSMTKGKTSIYATHRLGIARHTDKIIVLNHGRIEEIGTHESLIHSGGTYSKLYQVQAQWYTQ